MKQSSATANIGPDKRRKKEDGTFPIKLRITFKGERKYYATSYDASLEDWELIEKGKVRGKLKDIAVALSEIKVDAQKCCNGLDSFSFSKFEVIFYPAIKPITSLQSAFEAYIINLRINGQVGTASSYSNSCVSLHKFKRNIKFEDITAEFLRNYERWFINQGNSITTVGIYLRSLRAVVNEAIEKDIMRIDDYPFGKRKYTIPSGRNIKKALSLEEIALIYHYPAIKGSVDDMCRDYWILIYLCNGINVKDLCLLTYANIKEEFIVIDRAKTIRTKRSNPEPIRIALKDDAKRIIEKWGQLPIVANNYVFPHLKHSMGLEEQRLKIQLVIHLINEHMKSIAADLNINKPVTTYYARHSFATILKNSGVSTEFISEALGHSSLATTKSYLAGFEQDSIKKTTDVLLSFKNA